MSLARIWVLAIIANLAILVAMFVGLISIPLAAFGCFYTPPIGGAKCIHIAGSDQFWIGVYSVLGPLSIPWTVLLIFVSIPQRWRIK